MEAQVQISRQELERLGQLNSELNVLEAYIRQARVHVTPILNAAAEDVNDLYMVHQEILRLLGDVNSIRSTALSLAGRAEAIYELARLAIALVPEA